MHGILINTFTLYTAWASVMLYIYLYLAAGLLHVLHFSITIILLKPGHIYFDKKTLFHIIYDVMVVQTQIAQALWKIFCSNFSDKKS